MVEKLYHIIMHTMETFPQFFLMAEEKIWETDGKQEEEESQEMTG